MNRTKKEAAEEEQRRQRLQSLSPGKTPVLDAPATPSLQSLSDKFQCENELLGTCHVGVSGRVSHCSQCVRRHQRKIDTGLIEGGSACTLALLRSFCRDQPQGGEASEEASAAAGAVDSLAEQALQEGWQPDFQQTQPRRPIHLRGVHSESSFSVSAVLAMLLLFGLVATLVGVGISQSRSLGRVDSVGVAKRNRSLVDYGSDIEDGDDGDEGIDADASLISK
jgi:hypothetical protein